MNSVNIGTVKGLSTLKTVLSLPKINEIYMRSTLSGRAKLISTPTFLFLLI